MLQDMTQAEKDIFEAALDSYRSNILPDCFGQSKEIGELVSGTIATLEQKIAQINVDEDSDDLETMIADASKQMQEESVIVSITAVCDPETGRLMCETDVRDAIENMIANQFGQDVAETLTTNVTVQ